MSRLIVIGIIWLIGAVAVSGILQYPMAGILALIVMAARGTGRLGKRLSSHGTARIATLWEVARAGLLAKEGLILGRADVLERPSFSQGVKLLHRPSLDAEMACYLFGSAIGQNKQAKMRLLRLEKPLHLATFAATGRGKGVCVLVPNLISHRGSCVVNDPKGELFAMTAEHREREFRQRVVRLDPFALCGPGSASLNPLDIIDVFSDGFLDQCRDLANMLVVRTGRESETHWNDAAELVVTAFIAFVVACEPNPAERNLQTLRMLVSSREKFAAAVEAMQKVEAFGGVISRLGGLLSWFVDKELSSVLTTVQRHTAFLDSPAVARVTTTSTFDPRMLRTQTGATLYLCLPPDKLVTLAPLSRMWIGTVLRSVSTCGMGERNPVLFLLDEAAHLGKIQVLEDAVTLMRGMGVRLWFFFQSLQQLQKCYGEQAAVMLDNIDTQQYFGINSYESAEAVSKRIGDTTIAVKSVNRSTSYSKPVAVFGEPRQAGSYSQSQSVNTAPLGRRLLKPEEIIALPEDMALILHRNLPVIPATLPKYYNAPEFSQFMGVKPVWRLQFSMPPWALPVGKALLLNCGMVGAFVLLAYLSEHDFSLERVWQDLGLPAAVSPAGQNAPPFNQPVHGNEGPFIPSAPYETYQAAPSAYGPYQAPSNPYGSRFGGAPRVPDPY